MRVDALYCVSMRFIGCQCCNACWCVSVCVKMSYYFLNFEYFQTLLRDVLAQSLAQRAPMPNFTPPLPPTTPMDDVPSGSNQNPSSSSAPPHPPPNSSGASTRRLFLGGLHHNVTEHSLEAHFRRYGSIRKIEIPKDRATGAKRGFGFLEYYVSWVITKFNKKSIIKNVEKKTKQ